MSPELSRLLARFLVIGGAAIAFAWWQESAAAGIAWFLTVWAMVVMRPGAGRG